MGANYREHVLWQDDGIDKVNSLAEAAGIEVSSLSPGGFTAYSFMHPTDSTRSEGIAKLQYLAETCPQLGAPGDLGAVFRWWTDPRCAHQCATVS